MSFRQGRATAYSPQTTQNGTRNNQFSYSQKNQQINCTITSSPLAHHNYTWPSNADPAALTLPSQPLNQKQQPINSVTIVKHARSSPRPSQSTAPYPSPTYIQQHHNYSSSMKTHISNSSSSSNSPIHNSALQQLSNQNITITTHHGGGGGEIQQQTRQLSTVTITPKYMQQQIRSTGVVAANNNSNSLLSPHQQFQQQQQTIISSKNTSLSPNRRTRGENKKCRKVYGMDRRDQWCTQCRWKKACSRFGD